MRNLLLLPLLFALVFRAFIPAGFMPVVGSDGHFAMALCSDGLNSKLTYVATQVGDTITTEHESEHGNDSAHGPCAYAASVHNLVTVWIGPVLPTVAAKTAVVKHAAPGLAAPGAIPRAQSPRAPPTLS